MKSLTQYLASSLPMEKETFNALWKSKSPKIVNILLWIMLNSSLNSSKVLQRKLSYHCLMPSVCALCYLTGDFECSYFQACWFKILFFQSSLDLPQHL